MPNGAVHYSLWKKGWVLSAVTSAALIKSYPLISAFSLLGYWLGQFIDPDLDLVGITSAEGRAMRKWPLIGGLFVTYWMMYGYIFRGKHRAFATHSIFFSTVIRFFYAFWWVLWLLHKYDKMNFVAFQCLVGVFLGMFLADSIHIIADRYEHKRYYS